MPAKTFHLAGRAMGSRMVITDKKGRALTRPLTVTQLCCQYIRGQQERVTNSSGLKVVGRTLAGLPVLDDIIGDLLTICERTHTCALDG